MDNIMSTLTIILVMLIFFIVILAFIYWYLTYKNKKKNEESEQVSTNTTKIATEYTKKSIFKFMQFDKIEDNMIVQDNGQRYLMVIECDGVNYDLMSQVEKTAVESGFVQFLNTLRYPIQIYTQTRTINISDSIQNYKNRLEITKKELKNKEQEYNRLIKTENYNVKQAELLKKEVIRIKNLYEYGNDVVENISKSSQNKNVLRKHYYIIVPYYVAEMGIEGVELEEKKSMIFSELYTRAQSLIRALFACEMRCKILNSNELVELLYIAYNRDESETYGIEKAIKAGYEELFSTAPDVLDKRMKALDKEIEEKATELAKEIIDEVRDEKIKKINKKEDEFEILVREMAAALLDENKRYIGEETVKKAKKKISKKGGKANEQAKKNDTRRNAKTE